MKLLIMRHGDAGQYQVKDSDRELSELGILEAQVMAKWLNASDCQIDKVIVSPYVRAQQTAKHILDILNCKPQVDTLSLITPDGSATEVHDFLDGMFAGQKHDNVLMVSHMPLVSYLCSEMTFDAQSPIFPTAAIAMIDYDLDKMKGELTLMIGPDDFCKKG